MYKRQWSQVEQQGPNGSAAFGLHTQDLARSQFPIGTGALSCTPRSGARLGY
jgi:hypothetical protein